VIDFKTARCRYTVQYNNGQYATVNKTELKAMLTPIVAEEVLVPDGTSAAQGLAAVALHGGVDPRADTGKNSLAASQYASMVHPGSAPNVNCQHGRLLSQCKDCASAYFARAAARTKGHNCQHDRQPSQCKECASVFFGRTVTKLLDGNRVCNGTVIDFKTARCRYTVQYDNGTYATVTKTELKAMLTPVVEEQTAVLVPDGASAAQGLAAVALHGAETLRPDQATMVTVPVTAVMPPAPAAAVMPVAAVLPPNASVANSVMGAPVSTVMSGLVPEMVAEVLPAASAVVSAFVHPDAFV